MASDRLSFWNTPPTIIAKARPLLEPGEVVAHVIRAMEGPNKWAGLGVGFVVGIGLSIVLGAPALGLPIMWFAYTSLYPRRVVLATDRGVVVLAGGRYRFGPKRVLDRFDLETRIGPLRGLWLEARLGERRLYVVARCSQDVVEADRDLDAE